MPSSRLASLRELEQLTNQLLNTLNLGGPLCPQGLEEMWIACFWPILCKVIMRIYAAWMPQRTGAVGEPVAEYTKFGWTIMSPGTGGDVDSMFLAHTMQSDYEDLCRMDVVGITDPPSGDQSVVHAEFLEQLQRSPEGWYESGLPWKGDHQPLPSNKPEVLDDFQALYSN